MNVGCRIHRARRGKGVFPDGMYAIEKRGDGHALDEIGLWPYLTYVVLSRVRVSQESSQILFVLSCGMKHTSNMLMLARTRNKSVVSSWERPTSDEAMKR